jgi:hypothetical protein
MFLIQDHAHHGKEEVFNLLLLQGLQSTVLNSCGLCLEAWIMTYQRLLYLSLMLFFWEGCSLLSIQSCTHGCIGGGFLNRSSFLLKYTRLFQNIIFLSLTVIDLFISSSLAACLELKSNALQIIHMFLIFFIWHRK